MNRPPETQPRTGTPYLHQMEYSGYLDRLLDLVTMPGDYDFKAIYQTMAELCKLLRVSKGVTSFYRSPQHERLGKVEEFIGYDSGKPSKLISRERVVMPSLMIGQCDVYLEEGQEPWTPAETERISRIQHLMLSFLSKNRLGNEIERLTFYDDDGYLNIRYFLRFLRERAASGRMNGMVAARFNIRHFSGLNQELGRMSCNILMNNFIRELRDLIGAEGVVCRLGGDNFVLACRADQVTVIRERFEHSSVLYDKDTGKCADIHCAAGFFIIPDGYGDVDDILNKIMAAYDTARNGGRDEIVFANEDILSEKDKILQIQQMFKPAIENEEFLVYYQPKIDVFGNRLSGAEALCRWRHNGVIIPPVDFIPVLERSLDICLLDFYMLDHVCQDIRRWLDEGRDAVRVSVNLSRKHMVDADLFDHIVEIIDRNQVPHEYIEIELTETTTDVEFRELKNIVQKLQRVGISASVDDFGIGYSSLNLLREIPWNVLKVDKSFLPGDCSDEQNRNSVLFKYVIAMARELGLECVAEGVETREQVEALRENACNLAQGFYYDRPLPVETFEKRLAQVEYPVM
ncbi:MAG: GGDEF domain-containing protein [Clostridia bacterium]|nr:GGDEF domain-containing protein [Clostridia bacterium]